MAADHVAPLHIRQSRASSLLRDLALVALLTLAVVIVYWPVRDHQFISFDDDQYISNNQRVQQGLTLDNIAWAFTTGHMANWHPLTWLAHMLDCSWFGGEPEAAGWHHSVNVVWHALNAILLFFVWRFITGATWRSWLVAALFALHPLHVESVAWVSERKDLLSTFFGLAAIGAYVKSIQHGTRRWMVISLCCYALSLMAKPMMVTLPCVLLLLDFWPLKRVFAGDALPRIIPPRRNSSLKTRSARDSIVETSPGPVALVVEKWPYFVLAIASSVITVLTQRSGGAVETIADVGLDERVANAVIAYAQYMTQTIWPVNMAVFYPLPRNINAVAVFGSVAVLLVLSFTAVALARRFPPLIVGWLWFVGTLVPVIGLVQVGSQARADRYTYVPLIGLFVTAVWLIPRSSRSMPSLFGMVLRAVPVAVILAALAVVARSQVRHWRDDFTLFEHTLAITANNSMIENNYAVALHKAGRTEEAIPRFREALRISPRYGQAANNLGGILVGQNDLEEGIRLLNVALENRGNPVQAHGNLAVAYLRQGNLDRAIGHYEQAVAAGPTNFQSRVSLASTLCLAGRFDAALPHAQAAVNLQPTDHAANYHLGVALIGLQRDQEAIAPLQQAVRGNPRSIDSRLNLGTALFNSGRFDDAIEQYREILAIDPGHVVARNNLARALARAGQTEQAIAEAKRLIELQPTDAMVHHNLARLLCTTTDSRLRDPQLALELALRACELNQRSSAEMLATLATAQAATGRFTEAVQSATEAQIIARSTGPASLADEMQHRIDLYRAGRTE